MHGTVALLRGAALVCSTLVNGAVGCRPGSKDTLMSLSAKTRLHGEGAKERTSVRHGSSYLLRD